MHSKHRPIQWGACTVVYWLALGTSLSAAEPVATNLRAFGAVEVAEVCDATGVRAGLAVVLGARDGRLEIDLAESGRLLVHGLALEPQHAWQARTQIEARGLCGRVSVERVADLKTLPYAENLVNLLVADLDALGETSPSPSEVMRVLAPGGAAYLKNAGRWSAIAAQQTEGTDEWTHLNHGADGNPVSKDRRVSNPERLRWIASKVMGWGMFSIRSTDGRVLLFWDTLLQWVDPKPNMLMIEARDAYSGVLLWQQHYPFPVKERTRPVAAGDRIYMLSGEHVIGVDATDGEVVVTYRECTTPFDCVFSDGVLICRNDDSLCGFDARSGRLIWRRATREHEEVLARYAKRRKGHFEPGWRRQLLVIGDGRVYFAEHESDQANETTRRVVGLDIHSGKEVWQASGPHVGDLPHPCFYDRRVLFLTNENGYAGIPVTDTGRPWTIPVTGWKSKANYRFSAFSGIGISGYLKTDGLVWIKDRQKTRLGDDPFASEDQKPFKGWIGVDPLTGDVKRRIHYPSTAYWSSRCYADVAAPGRIFADNMEIVDLNSGEFRNFRAARGQCGSGFIFANGLVYTSPMRCVSCYPMLRGATALCGADDRGRAVADEERLRHGPAMKAITPKVANSDRVESSPDTDWPMYRHNSLRTNSTVVKLPDSLDTAWTANLKDRTSTPVVAGGNVFVAVVNQGRICALDARTGRSVWSFVAGSRIDTPPTIHGPLCLFGCHDGTVYCLTAEDGALVWSYNAAPEHRRIVAYDRVESPWPVMGSVLVYRDVAYALAGRLTRVDGGMHLVALDPSTGRRIWHHHLKGIYGDAAHVLPRSWYRHEEHMTNNILLAKGESLRLYDEFGTWQFALADGRLEGRSSEVGQPGFPRGRMTPKDLVAAERWPWCGWDRVTSSEMLAGEDTYNMMAPGMHPYLRAVPKYQAWLFPDRQRYGIYGTRLNQERQFVLQPARFTERNLSPEEMPWKPRTIDLDVKGYAFAGDTLVVSGGTPIGPHHTGGRLRTIAMATGEDLSVVKLPAAAIFDGMAIANQSVYVSTVDGKIVCLAGR